MDNILFKNFLNFLQRAGKVASQPPSELEEYTERMESFLEYSRTLDREPIDIVSDINRVLVSNGNQVEGGELLLNEAKFYLKDGKRNKYFGLIYRGLADLFSAVFIPEIYAELLRTLKEADKRYLSFFYNEKAYVEQIHFRDYENALNDYLHAKSLIGDIDDEALQHMGYRDISHFAWRQTLNLVDVIFKAAMKDKELKTHYLAMADSLLQEVHDRYGNNELVNVYTELFWVQYNIIAENPKLAKELMDRVLEEYGNKEWFNLFSAVMAYLVTLYHWSIGDYKATMKHLKSTIHKAIESGNEMMTKEAIDFSLFLIEGSGKEFSIYSKEGEEILNTILSILFAKDWYLGIDHSTKVAQLSLKMAREYKKLTGLDIAGEKVYMAGLLHDIGKLYVPWFVLNKPARLNNLEWLCIKYHPTYGREIMERIGLGEYARFVEEHHERNDGSGYPYGKRNLPPLSQIIGVADIFEAATSSNRFYKTPKSVHAILDELKAMSDSKFDGKVIDALSGALGENIKEVVL